MIYKFKRFFVSVVSVTVQHMLHNVVTMHVQCTTYVVHSTTYVEMFRMILKLLFVTIPNCTRDTFVLSASCLTDSHPLSTRFPFIRRWCAERQRSAHPFECILPHFMFMCVCSCTQPRGTSALVFGCRSVVPSTYNINVIHRVFVNRPTHPTSPPRTCRMMSARTSPKSFQSNGENAHTHTLTHPKRGRPMPPFEVAVS